ncbi:ISAs1 family transposase [Xenorhabdus bovienii]|nr:ISAs1 family transposase [Xenorhabdus bovienii]MDE9514834.1 ISAs1 family transposase [Xenorhabdus bovienii]
MTLIEHLSVVEETRSKMNQKHNLVDVIFLVINAILAGAEGWQDIQTYGDAKKEWLKTYRPSVNGIPRRHTIARILKAIVAGSLLDVLLNWVNERRLQEGKPIIAMDGKTLRGAYRNEAKTAVHLATAYDTQNGLVLSQKLVSSKAGEIQGIRQLIDIINVKGVISSLPGHKVYTC